MNILRAIASLITVILALYAEGTVIQLLNKANDLALLAGWVLIVTIPIAMLCTLYLIASYKQTDDEIES